MYQNTNYNYYYAVTQIIIIDQFYIMYALSSKSFWNQTTMGAETPSKLATLKLELFPKYISIIISYIIIMSLWHH